MASGILAQAEGDDSNTAVYTVPASTLAIVNFSVLAKGSADTASVYLLPSGDTLADKHYIEQIALDAKGVLERTNIVMEAGAVLGFNASADTVISVYGIEESV
ncbi:MAG: hypothetical protein Unbinned1469contig1000_17 [Prokaryotic dsDNA virus sp.]|jgi:hypothetical protein|nr:MAG: hypothetical protein Unbinned1469contig1000_17 [Prokaryotic dsDNA virus sp.]|tara:strand:+ start:20462 stop:20770 length:309 start_codon:yes stop_codon:yes gene_type:complete